MVENFKGFTIQSDKQVDTIIDSEEHVDTRNWLRNDSAEKVDDTNDSKKLVVDRSNQNSDPSVATHTTNKISTQKLYPLFIKPAIRAVLGHIETRSRASCGSPSFVAMSVSPT